MKATVKHVLATLHARAEKAEAKLEKCREAIEETFPMLTAIFQEKYGYDGAIKWPSYRSQAQHGWELMRASLAETKEEV